ncbi:MAG: SPOR domain-containing protein [Rhodanobacter sp.]
MILRLLFVLLSALNIVVAAWVWLGQPYAVAPRPVTDAGVAELTLLADLPAAAPPATPAIAHASAASTQQRCMALGPFATPQDLRHTRQALAGAGVRMRFRQEQVAQASTWWVYLPAAASRAAALATARQLDARRIADYFVVGAGEQPNSVSLGVFKDPANARRRLDEVAAAGFPARMVERVQTAPQYWLDVIVPAGRPFDATALGISAVRAHSTGCF